MGLDGEQPDLQPHQTAGLVCAHHHLYSALARGMPAPPRPPGAFIEILELVWWRLDRALDADTIEWSAKLAALEALERGTTSIVDHHESPLAIEGSLSIIADACAEVGVRVNCTYGITDRHGPEGAAAGLAENDRFLSAGGRGMVGLHAAFTCSDDTIAAAAELAASHGVGVHVHVAEGQEDTWTRLAGHTAENWWLVHGVYLPDDHGLLGTLIHNPRSNMNNGVGYARPRRFANRIGLGTDGIGADMLDEFRVAYVRGREDDVTMSPDDAWEWLEPGYDLFPEARNDRVTWNYAPMDPWRLAYSPGISPTEVQIDGQIVFADGAATQVDGEEIRNKAAEAAQRLFRKLETLT
ncbi:MAG: cytosine/adenosine deaminase-related metal-dependent hydrolase [Candidatus Aldehydirespiratoraceae bacterium]|jgi:cytosine/adenosine deaminase-related metal-dependent hydrolase